MKQVITLIILIFLLNPIFGQKHLEVPKTKIIQGFMEELPQRLQELKLKDLRTAKDSLNIRIWQSHKVFTINRNNGSTFSDYNIYTYRLDADYTINSDSEPFVKSFIFAENISQPILDSFIDAKIMDLKNEDGFGIDGSYVFVEIATKSNYKVVGYWSPYTERIENCKIVVHILEILNNSIDSEKLKNIFLNSLPPGHYGWGMTTIYIHIDKFLDKDIAKTDFYSQVERIFRTVYHITDKTNHWDFPIIILDNKETFISDLNKYKVNQISSIKLLKPGIESVALWGTSGINGVLYIKTKK